MDWTMRMVYETEGQHGGDIRGWNGREAQQEAMRREFEREQYEQAMHEQYEADMRDQEQEPPK